MILQALIMGMFCPKTGTAYSNAKLGLPVEGCSIKELVVYNDWDKGPLDLQNDLALGYYQLSPEV